MVRREDQGQHTEQMARKPRAATLAVLSSVKLGDIVSLQISYTSSIHMKPGHIDKLLRRFPHIYEINGANQEVVL